MAASAPPIAPPVAPMLARLVRELPVGDYLYEPKWDGFRALAFRDGDAVEIQSRHERPMARYFPELVTALRAVEAQRFALDGEIVIIGDGRFDFAALMLRTHPAASRVARLSAESPAIYVAFDVLAIGDEDLRDAPFAERRERLKRLLARAHANIVVTPATEDPRTAQRWFERYRAGGVDGVMAKHRSLAYHAGKRAMLKVKHERTADCVVAGFRAYPGELVASLLLGLFDENGALRHVGVCSTFGSDARRALFAGLMTRATPLEGHPWEAGFGLEGSPMGRLKGAAGRWDPSMSMDWMPVVPLVAEVAYDTLDGGRFRHPARFRRWRPDRDPTSCTFEQLADPSAAVADLAELLG